MLNQKFRKGLGMVFMILAMAGMVRALDVTGTVTDADSKDPISGVTVQIKGSTSKTTTDGQGKFTIAGPSGVTDLLQARSINGLDINWDQAAITIHGVDGRQVISSAGRNAVQTLLPSLADGIYLVKTVVNGQCFLSKIAVAGGKSNFGFSNTKSAGGRIVRAKAGATPVLMEAESMTLNGYEIDMTKLAGMGIGIADKTTVPVTATATKVFSGASGVYKITLTVFLEDDAQSRIKLYVGSTVVIDETYPLGKNQSTHDFTTSGVTVNNGDVIKIEGTSGGTPAAGAFARVDKIVFSDGMDVTLVFSHNDYVQKEATARLGGSVNVQLTKRSTSSGDKPGIHNTGPTGSLSTYSGPTTIRTAGTVIQNVQINGTITVEANNVTIRNFKMSAGHYGIKCINGNTGLVIEDGEIYNMVSAGIYGMGFTARRLYIHDSSGDGIKAQGGGGPVLVEACFIEKLGKGAEAHADGNQTRGGSNITFRGNNIFMPNPGTPTYPGAPYKSNATFMLQLSISNFLIEGNWLTGGNYCIYSPGGVAVKNNIFGRHNAGWPDKEELRIKNGTFTAWSGNVWEDTGTPCP